MEDTPQDFESPLELGDEPRPPHIAIWLTVVGLCICVVGVFAWYAMRLNTDPKKECSYRGGVWSKESDECIFESGVGAGKQQVGMVVSRIELSVPDSSLESSVSFAEVEIGGSQVLTQVVKAPERQISLSLLSRYGRVQKETQDLAMPFTVSSQGSGNFTYLGIFEKDGDSYRMKDSIFVGDRIGVEGLLLLQKQKEGTFLARLSYRGRREGQVFSEIPREPKTLEALVGAHEISSSWVKTREGAIFEDVVRIEHPAFMGTVTSAPLTVRGAARGNWFFKGEFPISLVLQDGRVLAQGVARASSEWETKEYVPFTASLSFKDSVPQAAQEISLVLVQGTPSISGETTSFKMPLLFK